MFDDSFIEIKEAPRRVFVIGDIHGCLTETVALVEHLFSEEGLAAEDLLAFVGDYVDRGPDSKGVIDYMMDLKGRNVQVAFLKGNHEDMLLNFLGFEGLGGDIYLANGGSEALASYGFTGNDVRSVSAEQMPPEHIEFLQGLSRYLIVGDYVVVHAGLNPLRDLRMQLDEDIYWIRDEFVANVHYYDKTIVFGHTPFQDVLFDQPYKIGIDTGLVYGNLLSCLELNSGQVFQVKSGETAVVKSDFESKGGEGSRL